MRVGFRCAFLGLSMVMAAGDDLAPSLDFDLGFGVQVWEVDGNRDLFRTQWDEDDGPFLETVTIQHVNAPGNASLFDRLRIDGSGFGGSPWGRVRMTAERTGIYRLKFSASRARHYSALPHFANPLIDSGFAQSQHTLDLTRSRYDMEWEFLIHRHWRPLAGFRYQRQSGPRQTTYHVGQDEFPLQTDGNAWEREWRLGMAYQRGRFQGRIWQGYRQFKTEESALVQDGAETGNNDRPVLGQDIALTDFQRQARTDAATPVTRVRANYHLDKVALLGSFVHADHESETVEAESLSGNLVSFALRRIYQFRSESIRSKTERPEWRGDLRVQAKLGKKARILARFHRRHRELDGWALAETFYRETFTFGGSAAEAIERIAEPRTFMEREEDLVEAEMDFSPRSGLKVWGGFSLLNQTTSILADITQIVVPINQEGELHRDVTGYRAGGSFKHKTGKISLWWRRDDANRPIVRTDFMDREKVRVSGELPWNKRLRMGVRFIWVDYENENTEIQWQGEDLQYGLNLDLALPKLQIHLAYDVLQIESRRIVRRPQDFQQELDFHREDGDFLNLHMAWNPGKMELRAGGMYRENQGILPHEWLQTQLSCGYSLTDHLTAALGWERHDYEEQGPTFVQFKADAYRLSLRWRR